MKRQWANEELIEHWILGPWDLAQVPRDAQRAFIAEQ